MGWGRSFANYFNNLPLSKKILLAVAEVGVIGLAGTFGIAYFPHHSHSVVPVNPEQLCAKLPDIPWFASATIHALQSNITKTIKGLCGGKSITDPSVIAAAQNTLETLRTTYANLTAKELTGHFFHRNHTGWGIYDLNTFDYLMDSLSDITSDNIQDDFFRLTADYGGEMACTFKTLQQISLGGIYAFCNRTIEPIFSAGKYSCVAANSNATIHDLINNQWWSSFKIWPNATVS